MISPRLVLMIGLACFLAALVMAMVPLAGTCGTPVGEAVGDIGDRTIKVIRFNYEFRPFQPPFDCPDLARRRLVASGVVVLLGAVAVGVSLRLRTKAA